MIYFFISFVFLVFLSTSFCVILFLRIRNILNELLEERKVQINIVERFMEGIVTKKQMESYLSKIDEDMRQLTSLRDKFSKEKWTNFHKAFGGKEKESEEIL